MNLSVKKIFLILIPFLLFFASVSAIVFVERFKVNRELQSDDQISHISLQITIYQIIVELLFLVGLSFLLSKLLFKKAMFMHLKFNINYSSLGLSLLFFISISTFGSYFTIFINALLFKTAELSTENYMLIEKMILNYPVISFFLICITTPIIEEIFFRGTFMNTHTITQKNTNTYLIISSSIFALMHFDKTRATALFFIGIGLGMIYLVTGNILYPIIIHALNNMFSVIIVLLPKVYSTINTQEKITPEDKWRSIIFGCFLFGIATFISFKLLIKRQS